jgi:hypothetical protein
MGLNHTTSGSLRFAAENMSVVLKYVGLPMITRRLYRISSFKDGILSYRWNFPSYIFPATKAEVLLYLLPIALRNQTGFSSPLRCILIR